jgi:alanyl-tRNA synthetase
MADMDQEYQLRYFADNGFTRRICASCGSPFWTLGDQEHCGDTPCVEYGFIDNPLTGRKYELREMREAFLDFFATREDHPHTRLDRYPVIARWRKDIYLTIASIADFQPHCTSGEVPPPANPLVISQPCIRLNDLDSVGKSGRHLSCFEMMGHHSFNSEKLGEIYWKDETVDYCHRFMTDTLGMRSEDLIYKENPWSGGGNAGPALEVMNHGLEVATLVFMCYIADPDGEMEIKGDRYSPMDIRIVDTGYGLERLVWATNGSPTLYDAIFPDITGKVFAETGLADILAREENRRILEEHVKLCGMLDVSSGAKLEGLRVQLADRLRGKGIEVTPARLAEMMEPVENVYTLIEHFRALTFMFADVVVPSNVKADPMSRRGTLPASSCAAPCASSRRTRSRSHCKTSWACTSTNCRNSQNLAKPRTG